MPAWVGTPSAGKTGHRGDPRLWGKTGHSDPRLYCAFFAKTGRSDVPLPLRRPSICEAYRELIEQGLARGRNGKAIWQDLVSDHGFAGDYQAVKRFVRKLRGPQRPEAAGIILTAPGEEAQVDYGSGPMVRDPADRQVSPDTVVRSDPRLQPEIRAPVGVAIEWPHLGGVA